MKRQKNANQKIMPFTFYTQNIKESAIYNTEPFNPALKVA